jgi:hypothetical protein
VWHVHGEHRRWESTARAANAATLADGLSDPPGDDNAVVKESTDVSVEVRGSAPFYLVLKGSTFYMGPRWEERYVLEELRRSAN